MSNIYVIGVLRRRWYIALLVIVVAVAVAIAAKKSVSSSPTGTATVQILVDSDVSSLVNLQGNQAGLESRASVMAQAMTSNAAVAAIAKAGGVGANDVTAQGPFTGTGEVLDVPTPSEARGMQLVSVKPQYHLTFVAQNAIPIITVTVLGPTPLKAGQMANAVLPGTRAWLDTLASAGTISSKNTVVLRQLGSAQAGTVNSSTPKIIAIVAAVAVLILGLLFIGLFDRTLLRRRLEEVDGTPVLPVDGGDGPREQLPAPAAQDDEEPASGGEDFERYGDGDLSKSGEQRSEDEDDDLTPRSRGAKLGR